MIHNHMENIFLLSNSSRTKMSHRNENFNEIWRINGGSSKLKSLGEPDSQVDMGNIGLKQSESGLKKILNRMSLYR